MRPFLEYFVRTSHGLGLKPRGGLADALDVPHEVPTARRTSSESAFTLVELMVVILIIAILIGVGVFSVRAARSSGQAATAVAAAHAYADAADEFARDHGGRYPVFGNANDWPSAAADRGPQDPQLGTTNKYLRAVPENVQDGTVKIAASADANLPTLVYTSENGDKGFSIVVNVPGKDPCAIRGGTTKSTTPKSCSNR